jgi:hypothetical protein
MRALLVLSLKDNKLLSKEAGKALAKALTGNSTLKELDASSNDWIDEQNEWAGDGPGFAQELAIGIRDNGSISQFTFSGDGRDYRDITPVTMETP